MVNEEKIWIGRNEKGEKIFLEPGMANRHGLIAGATGTGKTVTLKVMAESFSAMGVPVFLSDVKGDLAGICVPGEDNENMKERIERFGLAEAGFEYGGFPVVFWDLFGKNGIQLRTTISEMGPVLLARILELNDLQADILTITFKIADDKGLLLVDTKDLKAMLNYISENNQELSAEYGNISKVSVGAIVRAVVSLELKGGDVFFGEPALNVTDLFGIGAEGKGLISVLDSQSLIHDGTLYSTFLLYLISELFENLPEVGDLQKPKMIFFFDEAHLLFKNAGKALLEKIEQVVKLIRSRGVGIYFVTQNPRDIPDGVLAQLGNKVEHALHAYTPADQKAVKAAAESFRVNPEFDTCETIMALGTGEAVISFLDPQGIPGIAEKVSILPPRSRFGGIEDTLRQEEIRGSLFFSKYANSYDPDSAYEFLKRMGIEEEEAREAEKAAAREEKERQKAEAAEEKERLRKEAAEEKERARQEAAEEKARIREQEKKEKEEQRKKEQDERRKKQAAKSVGTTVAGTVGREIGKQAGKSFGSFGKTLGGNVGASLGRGLLSTLFKL